ncbi:hypothetical protein KAS50_07935, partial [bacterium]|nr:hypothetical protein [bacterium]
DGKYDLNQWNDEYWNRFQNMLKWTQERDIIVQIEVWAFHDFTGKDWDYNPWNPADNINYTSLNTKLKEYYGDIGKVCHDFFFTVPKLNNDCVVLSYQKKFADKMLSYTLQYGNVLYCMSNEIHPQYSPEWGWYWADYIRNNASNAGKKVETSEMFWQIDLKKEQQRASLDYPNIYSYFEASQNSAITKGQENWDNLQFVYNYLDKNPRPVNHTKIYGADTGPWEGSTDRHATESFWRNIIGGSASSRFHRPPHGIGLDKKAQAHIKSMRMLTSELDIFNCKPDSKSILLTDRSDNEAYLTYIVGKQYAVYFPNGGSVGLNLSGINGSFIVKWLDITDKRWKKEIKVKGNRIITLTAPGEGHWAALVAYQNIK